MASTTDVAGRKRIGMFEKVEDPDTGETFEQTSGRGNIAQFKTSKGDTFVAPTSASSNGLAWRAREAGADLPEPDMGLMFHSTRKTL